MKYFSLFSGVEGFGLGFPKDWECVGFSEIDKYANQVLKYHFPEVKNFGDCVKINYDELPNFDVLVGGSPCQDFSIAGKRRGLKGSRSSLAWEFIRCLRSKKPGYFIWENVKGVLSSRGGWDFANLLTAFSESGYSLWWQVLNAKDFGVPQNRERVFVIGFRERSPKEVFFERESNKKTIIARTLNASDWRGVNRNQQGNIIEVQNKGTSQHYRVYGKDGLAPTLQSQSGMSSQKHPFVAVRKSGDRGKQKVYTSKTMGALSSNPMSDATPQVSDGSNVRKLMPIECERLMSWPDDWTRWGINEKGEKVEISDSQRYKMCGNGVVSKVVEAIVKEIL